MKLKGGIYWYFWITSFLIFIYGITMLVWKNDNMLTLHIKDFNLAVDRFQLTIFFKVVYLVLGLIYWVGFRLKLKLNPTLTKIHTIISIGGVAANALVMLAELVRENAAGSVLDTTNFVQRITLYIFVVVLLAQLLFIYNFGSGLLKSKQK